MIHPIRDNPFTQQYHFTPISRPNDRIQSPPEGEHKKQEGYTLRDVINAARTETRFNYTFWLDITLGILFKHGFRLFSSFLVVIVTILVTIIASVGMFIVLPRVATPGTLWHTFNVIWGILLIYSITFNYYHVVTTPPGRPSDVMAATPQAQVDPYQKICKKCNNIKPPRTHHCSVCQACVVKMDHHCPWVNNCVGHGNYRYFYGFLLWTTVATFYLSVVMIPAVFVEGNVLYELISLKKHPAMRGGAASVHDARSSSVTADSTGHGGNSVFEALTDLRQRHEKEVQKHRKTTLSTGNDINVPVSPPVFINHKEISHKPLYQQGNGYWGGGTFAALRSLWGFATMPNVSKDSILKQAVRQQIMEQLQQQRKQIQSQSQSEIEMETELETETETQNQQSQHASSQRRRLSVVNPLAIMINADKIHSLINKFPVDILLTLSFAFTTAICMGVGTLWSFHTYLISTAQTTLEFYENLYTKQRAKLEGFVFVNPYCKGSWLGNFQQIFGADVHPLLAILPHRRDPPPLYVGVCHPVGTEFSHV